MVDRYKERKEEGMKSRKTLLRLIVVIHTRDERKTRIKKIKRTPVSGMKGGEGNKNTVAI